MVCPNCNHELNPFARVCPTCGTPISTTLPVPTVVIAPPAPGGLRKPPSKPRKKKKVTAARVFVVIFCLLAVVMNAALVAFWFLPSIRVTDNASPSSVSLYSMYGLTWGIAPYLTVIICVLCAISAAFCMVPLFKKHSVKRKRLIIPKLMTILCAVCYAVPYLVVSLAKKIDALINGGAVSHQNFFTLICLCLFVLLCITAELTALHTSIIRKRQIEDLKAQLTEHGIQPEEW